MLSIRPLSSVMRSPLVTIPPEISAGVALSVAAAKRVHHLPVTQRSELVGFVCTCDLHEAPPRARVSSLMSQHPVALDGSHAAGAAARLMRERRVGSCVVTFGGRPVGIVTRADLLEEMPELADLADEWHCECCGSTRHLLSGEHGQILCAGCRDRACDDGWYDVGTSG